MQTSVLFGPAPSLPRIELVVPTYGFDQFATDGQSPISRARGSTYFYPSPTTGWEWTRRPKRVFSSPSSQPRNREKVQAWGLATVYGIIKQSGGFIWVESEPGSGARFEIYLPRVTDRVEPASAQKEEITISQGLKTVLVAEDEEAVRELACEFLKSAGYNVLTASNGVEALAIAEGSKQHIHALLTDLVMPRMRGFELAKRLKTLQPQIKVIYASGYLDYQQTGNEFVEEALFIQKPFTRTTLVARMAELLKEDSQLLVVKLISFDKVHHQRTRSRRHIACRLLT